MKKVLLSPSSFGSISLEPIRILEKNGYETFNNPYGRKLKREELILLAKDCCGVVAGVESYDKVVLDELKNLKCISRVGVGIDSIDVDYAKEKEIHVVNTPFGPTRSVAELTIGLTFSLLRKIPFAHCNLKSKIWKKETGNLLFEKQIGVVGLGKIGKLVSETFKNLGNQVNGYDLYPDNKWASKNEINICSLNEIFENSDIITLHIPGSPNKLSLINEELILKMKNTSFLINVSRGGVVDENHLYNALKSNNIAGAAIDVFNEEPYSGKLIDLNNVILTPHLGSYAAEGKLKMEIDAVENLIKYFNK